MKSRGKAILWVFLVFLVGVVFGGTLTFWGVQPRLSATGDSPSWRQETHRKQHSGRIINRLSELLDLDASQELELRQILEDSRRRFVQANREAKKRSRAIRMDTRERIRAILKPEQLESFEEFLKRKDRDRKKGKPSGPSR